MNRRIVLHILAAATLAACSSDGPTAVANDAVTVVREGNSLRITNKTDQARAFAAFDPNWLMVADLSIQAFCVSWEASCLRLPAHGSITVPLTDVGGYSASTTSITVYTWRVVMSEVNGQLVAVGDDPILLKLQ